MKAICVDDEQLLVEDTVAMCLSLPEIDAAKGFVRAGDALAWLEKNPADLAVLDINMPDMNGLELAARIREKWPKTAILFLTGSPQYAVEAFAVRASGYLLKPVTRERLASDVAYALAGRRENHPDHVSVRTFGQFEVCVDGNPVRFKMAKCKEILAYLVDRQGSGVTRAELCAVIWEDRLYDRKMQKQVDVYIRSLRKTLQEYGIGEIMEMKNGVLRIVPERVVCDAYLFFSGDSDAVNAYRGEYMSSYSWASITEGVMSWRQRKDD